MAIRAFRYVAKTGTTDLIISLYDSLDALISSFTMTELGSSGVYRADVNLTQAMEYGVIKSTSNNLVDIFKLPYLENSTDIADTIFARNEWTSAMADLSLIRDIEAGKWEIINNQMVFYKQDNVTEVARFNLFDASGTPSETNLYSREKV